LIKTNERASAPHDVVSIAVFSHRRRPGRLLRRTRSCGTSFMAREVDLNKVAAFAVGIMICWEIAVANT